MTTHNQNTGERLKDTITKQSETLDRRVLQGLIKYVKNAAIEGQKAIGIENEELIETIGSIVEPVISVSCPILGVCDDQNYVSISVVLESLISHFAGKENLQKLPSKIQGDVLEALFQLNKILQRIGKYPNLFYECANLFMLKNWDHLTEDERSDLISWYGDHH